MNLGSDKKSYEPGPGALNPNRLVVRDYQKGVGTVDKKTGDLVYRDAITGHVTRERKKK